jgi:hypothetical protein
VYVKSKFKSWKKDKIKRAAVGFDGVVTAFLQAMV